MKVNQINFYNNQNKQSQNRNFKAHPDYVKLAEQFDIKISSFFRRGREYGPPSEDYVNVINCLRYVLSQKSCNKIKILIAGIGESQEPLSLLAVIKGLLKNEPLNKNIDLHIVDLQSKPSSAKLFKQSFLDDIYPKYAQNSFIYDEGKRYGLGHNMHYRVTDEIFDFLNATYNNPKKSHWESRIQDVIKTIPDKTFDIVSINNTLRYINEELVICKTIKNVIRTLKKDRVFITDPVSEFNKICSGETREIYQGIFKKN